MNKSLYRNVQSLTDAISSRVQRLQRYQEFKSWGDAVRATSGYESVTSAMRFGPQANWFQEPSAFNNREWQAVAAFGVAFHGLNGARVSVLDLGGWDGTYASPVRACFPSINVSWTVVETVSVAVQFERVHHPQWLRWSADVQEILDDGIDIVFASGSLHLFPDPDATLRKLMTASRYVILTRLPLWPLDEHRPAAQIIKRGTSVGYPNWFFSEATFLENIRRTGGRVIAEWEVPEDSAYFAGQRCSYRGLLIDCREASTT